MSGPTYGTHVGWRTDVTTPRPRGLGPMPEESKVRVLDIMWRKYWHCAPGTAWWAR